TLRLAHRPVQFHHPRSGLVLVPEALVPPAMTARPQRVQVGLTVWRFAGEDTVEVRRENRPEWDPAQLCQAAPHGVVERRVGQPFSHYGEEPLLTEGVAQGLGGGAQIPARASLDHGVHSSSDGRVSEFCVGQLRQEAPPLGNRRGSETGSYEGDAVAGDDLIDQAGRKIYPRSVRSLPRLRLRLVSLPQAGSMLWLRWKRLSGSYARFTVRSRAPVAPG